MTPEADDDPGAAAPQPRRSDGAEARDRHRRRRDHLRRARRREPRARRPARRRRRRQGRPGRAAAAERHRVGRDRGRGAARSAPCSCRSARCCGRRSCSPSCQVAGVTHLVARARVPRPRATSTTSRRSRRASRPSTAAGAATRGCRSCAACGSSTTCRAAAVDDALVDALEAARPPRRRPRRPVHLGQPRHARRASSTPTAAPCAPSASGLDARCIGAGERLYIPMPFFWTGGFAQRAADRRSSPAPRCSPRPIPEPERTLELLERERATLFRGWPDQAARLAAAPAVRRRRPVEPRPRQPGRGAARRRSGPRPARGRTCSA